MDILLPTPTTFANQPLLLCQYNSQLLSRSKPSLVVTAYITPHSHVLVVSGIIDWMHVLTYLEIVGWDPL